MRLAGASCCGPDLCQAALIQEEAQEGDGKGRVGEGAAAWWVGIPSVENTFPKSPAWGQEGAPLPLLGPVITGLSFKACYKPD